MTSLIEPSAEQETDIHTTAGKLADLRKRAEEALRLRRRAQGRGDRNPGRHGRAAFDGSLQLARPGGCGAMAPLTNQRRDRWPVANNR